MGDSGFKILEYCINQIASEQMLQRSMCSTENINQRKLLKALSLYFISAKDINCSLYGSHRGSRTISLRVLKTLTLIHHD